MSSVGAPNPPLEPPRWRRFQASDMQQGAAGTGRVPSGTGFQPVDMQHAWPLFPVF